MARMKFLCDAERCIECNACVTACKNEHEVPWGVNRRRVVTINDGKPGERSISVAGLRTAIPSNIELVPGPGCPVCICPEEDVFEAIQLALNEDVILVAFGDMLRVPVNVPKRDPRSLEQARAAGGDIRPIASPLDAVRIAKDNPDRQVVFFGMFTVMALGSLGHGRKELIGERLHDQRHLGSVGFGSAACRCRLRVRAIGSASDRQDQATGNE